MKNKEMEYGVTTKIVGAKVMGNTAELYYRGKHKLYTYDISDMEQWQKDMLVRDNYVLREFIDGKDIRLIAVADKSRKYYFV